MTKALPGRVAACLVLCALVPTVVHAQQVVLSTEDYLEPPDAIARVITSEAMSGRVSLRDLGPDGEHFLVPRSGGMPPLSALARPYVNLGETAIDHRADRSRRMSIGSTVGYDLLSWKTGATTSIQVPDGVTVSGASWSPDGSRLAFIVGEEDASYIWVADVGTGDAQRLTDRPLLASLVSSLQWTGDGNSVCAVLVPEDREAMPERDPVAREPSVWVTNQGNTPSRTYRFLLKTTYDKRLLEYLTTGQLAFIDVSSGAVTPVGEPAMIRSFSLSPDAGHLRVTTMQKPFSYLVPTSRCGTREEIWDAQGRVLKKLSERKLQTGPPTRGARPGGGRGGPRGDQAGRRQMGWRPDGQGLGYLQREPARKPDEKKPDDAAGKGNKAAGDKPAPATRPVDRAGAAADAGDRPAPKRGAARRRDTGGDAKPGAPDRGDRPQRRGRRGRPGRRGNAVGGPGGPGAEEPKRKDRVMQWLPPFDEGSVKVVWESDDPIQSVRYSQDCRTLFVTQRKKGATHIFAVKLDEGGKVLPIDKTRIEEGGRGRFRGFRGRGGGGAGLLTRRGARGGSVVRTDGTSVWLRGTERPKDTAKQAPRPWLDRVELATGKKQRLWQSAKDRYETLQAVTGDSVTTLVISSESPTTVPDSWLKDLKSGKTTRLTHNRDPAPEVTRARHLRFKVKRVDGFEFWVRATVPIDHGEKLPALFWFYPREYTDQKSYDRGARRFNKNRFPALSTRSMDLLTLLGYVVVQPDCPIVGPQGRMNDNYVPDLRNSLWAVIDALDKQRIIDRDRLAIGGHSYGAFGTANALVHTPFFRAGIAGDGNYNRTLTPMSFQSERRHIWQARETYFRMSPLLWANQVNGALLMYHGADDTNTGTFPINSPRMFQALNGLGKPASLYVYPYEGHGPRARETILDLWSRWTHWLEIHVKHPERAKEMYEKPEPRKVIELGGR